MCMINIFKQGIMLWFWKGDKDNKAMLQFDNIGNKHSCLPNIYALSLIRLKTIDGELRLIKSLRFLRFSRTIHFTIT